MYECVDVAYDWSSIDGEQFVGDQEFFEDQQDQQESFDQGKYN